MFRISFLILLSHLPFVLTAQQAGFDWSQKCGNPPNTTDTKTCLASGVYGSFVMAGEFLNDAVFGDKTLTSSGGTDVFVVKYASTGDVISADRIGGQDYDFIRDVKMDGLGNIYLLGYFYGSIQLGSNLFTSYGSQDIFIAKMDDVGKVTLSLHIGGTMADYPAGIALDQDNNIVFAGYFYDGISIGDTTLAAINSSEIYVARFSPEGDLMNVTQAGGSSSDQVSSLSVDPEGNINITGSFYNDFTIADTTFTTTCPVGVFVAEFTPGLELSWAFQLQGSYLNTGVIATVSQSGDLYLAGSFSEDITFGSETFSAGEFNQDVFLAKYDGSGSLEWARHGHSRASDDVTGLGVDNNDNVYITGHFLDTLNFEQLLLPYTLCCGSREVYIVNYTNDGRPWWGEQVSGTRATHQAMTINSEDHVLLSGIFTEDLVIGADTLLSYEGYRNFVTGLSGDVFTMITGEPRGINFTIFPNPASHLIHFNSPENIFRVEVFNLLGARVLEQTGEMIQSMDISTLLNGNYIVRAKTGSGSSITRKVVVIR